MAIFHELDYGGAQRVIIELGKRLIQNHSVDLYYIDEEKDKLADKIFFTTRWYKFLPKKWKGDNWKIRLYKDSIEMINLYRLHKKIAEDIDIKKYDFIFVHPSKYTQAPFLLSLIKTKSIYYCQEPLRMVYDTSASSIIPREFHKKMYELINRFVRKWIDKRNIYRASLILANSKFSRQSIKNAYDLTSIVCYLGVDINIFKPKNYKKEYDIIFIGDNSTLRGYDLLMECVKKMSFSPKLLIINRNSRKPVYTDEQLIEMYNKSKILLALNYHEPFGLIPLEAMACGVPVVAINEGGYKESVVNGKTGYLVSRDAGAVAEKVQLLLANPTIREKMGKNAREHATKNWTWEKSVDRFEIILKKFINYKQ